MTLKYLLDTNICIYIAKQTSKSILTKFEKLAVGEVGISIITYGELLYGANKSKYKQKTINILEELFSLIMPLPMPINAGQYYGQVRSQLELQGKIIGNNDLWIAAHCLSLDLILVSNNIKEFSRIKNLRLENWD